MRPFYQINKKVTISRRSESYEITGLHESRERKTGHSARAIWPVSYTHLFSRAQQIPIFRVSRWEDIHDLPIFMLQCDTAAKAASGADGLRVIHLVHSCRAACPN